MNWKTISAAILVAAGLTVGCGKSPDQAAAAPAGQDEHAGHVHTDGDGHDHGTSLLALDNPQPAADAPVYEVGCGMCIFEMPGVDSCKAAVKIDGKPHLLTGVAIDAHGLGLCKAAAKAGIEGELAGDAFKVTAFALVPGAVPAPAAP